MAKTKNAFKSSKGGDFMIEPERRWAVVLAKTGKRVLLPSEHGIDRQEAVRISSTLAAETEVVPEAALDRYGRLVPELFDNAVAVATAPKE